MRNLLEDCSSPLTKASPMLAGIPGNPYKSVQNHKLIISRFVSRYSTRSTSVNNLVLLTVNLEHGRCAITP